MPLFKVSYSLLTTEALFRRERNGTERNRSKKWNAEGLRSDGTTLNRTVPFQKLDLFNK